MGGGGVGGGLVRRHVSSRGGDGWGWCWWWDPCDVTCRREVAMGGGGVGGGTRATPRVGEPAAVQSAQPSETGSTPPPTSIHMMKLVLWPLVLSTPARVRILYTGQR